MTFPHTIKNDAMFQHLVVTLASCIRSVTVVAECLIYTRQAALAVETIALADFTSFESRLASHGCLKSMLKQEGGVKCDGRLGDCHVRSAWSSWCGRVS